MKLSFVAAMDKNHLIGANNKLPWHLPADLAHFKKVTLGKPIVMGRKTYESIGRPLPGRRNIVITRQKTYTAKGCDVLHSVEQLFDTLGAEKEVMLIGGAQLFEALLPKANTLYLTLIDAQFKGDTYFPTWKQGEWRLVERERHEADEKNRYSYTFLTLKRL